MNKIIQSFHAMRRHYALFVRCECGATAIEYALIATLVSVAIITALTSVGSGVFNLFTTVAKTLP